MQNKQKRKEEEAKMKKVDAKSLEAVHTHTHTQVFLVKYGAKEEVESTRRVVILPRDCE